jgi:hypothetical protein|nr:MAG TPA: hypothetical protein [Caudoviricetes sp.]
MKSVKGTILVTVGILFSILSVGCGGLIENATTLRAGLFYAFLSVSLLAVALVMCALGVNAENEYDDRKSKKISRVTHHTNKWRNAK